MSKHSLALSSVIALFLFGLLASASFAQPIFPPGFPRAPAIGPVRVFAEGEEVVIEGDAEPMPGAKAAAKTDEQTVIEIPREAVPVNPREIRLHLMDGSVIAGELSVDEIVVETEFGDLTVPVAKIRSFTPGLDSYKELSSRIDELFNNLNSDDFQTREDAHKQLLSYGLKLRKVLDEFGDVDNAESKRHLDQLRKELDELSEEESFDDLLEENPNEPWIRGDRVVTTEFTIVGRIKAPEFAIASKYGPLTVKLSDVRLADRDIGAKQSVSRSLTVSGNNLIQRGFKSAGIRVEKGDKITVRADGNIVMSPWGSNFTSTPDGGAYFGWYTPNDIPGGALVARVGSKGKVFKVGARKTFVATSSGLLEFAIAMQPDYAHEGYNFPGQFSVRVKIEPK